MKGLALCARLGDDPLITSSLAIRMTDEALRRFDKELELDICPAGPGFQPETTAWTQILMHAEDLTIITLSLERRYYRNLCYNLTTTSARHSPSSSPSKLLLLSC